MFGNKEEPQHYEPKEPKDYRDFFGHHIEQTKSGDYKITVYVCKGPQRGNTSNLEYVDTFYNQLPPLEDLGLRCGGVTLKFYGHRLDTGEKHHATEHLHESWNMKKAIHDKKVQEHYGGINVGPSMNGLNLTHMREFIGMMKEFQDVSGQKNQDEVYKNAISAVYETNAKIIEETMKRAAKINLDSLKQVPATTEPKEPDPVDHQWGPVVGEVVDMLKKWGDKFLNAGPYASDQMKQHIQQTPAYDILKERPEFIQNLFSICSQDPTIGEEKIIKILEKLGMEVQPQEGPPPGGPQPGAPEPAPNQAANYER